MDDCLLLNASYTPIRVITWHRAVLLIVKEKAELVEAADTELRSASSRMPLPKVIRLIKMVRIPYRARIPLTRKALVARDQGRCQYCGRSGSTIDHVVPRSRGGKHTWANVVLACNPCNARKDDHLLEELGWTLDRKPSVPHGTQWLVIAVGHLDPAWEPYLAVA